jgi:Na+/melibiose symporter-like transporter
MKGNFQFLILLLAIYGTSLLANLTMSFSLFFSENETMTILQYKEMLKHDAILSFGLTIIVIAVLWKGLKRTFDRLTK